MRFDFVKPMLVWYNENARDLPWRRTKDPYLIWVSDHAPADPRGGCARLL